jgi:hypothetical protein
VDVVFRFRRAYESLASRLAAHWSTAPQRYERRALAQIDELKNPEPSRLGSVLSAINKPMAVAAEVAIDNKVGETISKGVEGIMSMLNNSASWSMNRDFIYGQFRANGHPYVHKASDIHKLELSDVDATIGRLAAKSESLAFAEGAGTGVLGLPGMALDIPGLVAIALRAINQYATYYGFDPSLEDEKAFVLMLLAVVSAATVEDRQTALVELTRMSVLLASDESRAKSRRLLSAQTVSKVAQVLASHLVKAKMAQSIPVVGAGVAAAVNAWLMRTVTQTAHQLYRERFLIAKRGPQVAVRVRRLPRGGAEVHSNLQSPPEHQAVHH